MKNVKMTLGTKPFVVKVDNVCKALGSPYNNKIKFVTELSSFRPSWDLLN